MINIKNILKHAQKGLKLYSPAYGEVAYYGLDKTGDMCIKETSTDRVCLFDEYGRILYSTGECMLFPSEENRDWNTFGATISNYDSFKDGDVIVVCNENNIEDIMIFKKAKLDDNGNVNVDYYILYNRNAGSVARDYCLYEAHRYSTRLATEREKTLLNAVLRKKKTYFNTVNKKVITYKEDLKPFDKCVWKFSNETWKASFVSYIKSGMPIPMCYWNSCAYNLYILPFNEETEKLIGTRTGIFG